MTNQPTTKNRLLSRIIPFVVAAIIVGLLSPTIANRLGLPLPAWFPFGRNSASQETVLVEEEADSSETVIAEAWPTPSGDLLAASGNVTPVSGLATPVPMLTRTPFPTPTQIVLPTPAWRELSYLTSVKFTASTLVDAERERTITLLGDITTDRLLLKAVGEILVGIDLSRISNIEIDGPAIRLSLPPAEVMAVELLPDESEVYASASRLLLSQYEGLEMDALEQARRQLRIEVTENPGLMELTQKTARLQLIEFLETVGYEEITIVDAKNP